MIKKYNLWLSLPLLFFVNLSINAWLWFTIQEGFPEWGVTSRAVAAIASFIAIPFSTIIERTSWGKISSISAISLILGVAGTLFPFSVYTISISTFLISISGYLMIFRTQIEYTTRSDGAKDLRSFTTWYGAMCTISPLFAGYWAEYFKISSTWLYLVGVVLLISLISLIDVYRTKSESGTNFEFEENKKANLNLKSWLDLIKDPEAMRLVRQSVIFSGTMSTLNVVVPIWAIENNWSAGDAGLIIGIVGISSLIIRLVFNRIKWSEKNAQTFVQYSAWLCAIFFGIWPWIDSWALAVVIAILYGLFYGLAAPLSLNLYAWVSQRRENPGTIWGLRSLVGATISISSPPVLGWSISAGCLSYVWSGFSVFSLLLDRKQIKKNFNRQKIWWENRNRGFKVKTLPPEDCH